MKKTAFLLSVLISCFIFCYGQESHVYHWRKGYKNFEAADYIGAISEFSKVIEIHPKDTLAYFFRGVAKGRLEDRRGAIIDLTKAIELNPEFRGAYYMRGGARYELGDRDGGCLDWSKAGELGDAEAYEMIRKFCR